MMKRAVAFMITMSLLASCTLKENNQYNKEWSKDTDSLDILMGQFSHDVENIWGFNKILVAGPNDYVQYTDTYQTRSHINFYKDVITIETITKKEPKAHLHQAIVNTLLMYDNLEKIDFSRSNINRTSSLKESFFYGKMINQPISLRDLLTKFADYLLQNCLKSCKSGLKIIYSVTINLIPSYIDKRADKYINMVSRASKKYGIEKSLILAIIQTESSFNPYAISRSDALGLMQVMRNSAGRDVFRAQGKTGIPSRNYLFDPARNIDVGTAYLAMLNNIYLHMINDPISRRYAMIVAYNSGVDSVLRIFSNDKLKAANIINSMSPRDFYIALVTHLPSEGSRRYLQKVNIAQKGYQYK